MRLASEAIVVQAVRSLHRGGLPVVVTGGHMSALIEKVLGANWRTTSASMVAIGALLTELAKLIDGDSKTVVDWEVVAVQSALAWGLLNARDAKVSSERSGAK